MSEPAARLPSHSTDLTHSHVITPYHPDLFLMSYWLIPEETAWADKEASAGDTLLSWLPGCGPVWQPQLNGPCTTSDIGSALCRLHITRSNVRFNSEHPEYLFTIWNKCFKWNNQVNVLVGQSSGKVVLNVGVHDRSKVVETAVPEQVYDEDLKAHTHTRTRAHKHM